MAERESYQYSRGPIGLPSVLLAMGWIVIWLLWPSLVPGTGAQVPRRVSGVEVSYGVVEESLYMSPLLFARATRVGFRAPEEASSDADLLDLEPRSRTLRYLHVAPPAPDYGALRRQTPEGVAVKQVDGYRPLWKDSADFETAAGTNAVTVELSAPLRERGYRPGGITWPEGAVELQRLEIRAFVAVDADGMTEGVFLEQGSGHARVDADVVRALEKGKAAPGAGSASGRVSVTMRRGNEGQD